MRFSPSLSFSPLLITCLLVLSQILNIMLFLPMPFPSASSCLPVVLFPFDCLSQWLMSVLIGWRWSLRWGQEGWHWAVPSHCVTAACNQEKQDETVPPHLLTHTHTPVLFFIIAVLEHRENSGIEVERGNKEWKESDTEREAEKEIVNKHFNRTWWHKERGEKWEI